MSEEWRSVIVLILKNKGDAELLQLQRYKVDELHN